MASDIWGLPGGSSTPGDDTVTSAKIVNGTIDETDLDASINASLDLADSAAQQAFKTIAISGQSDVVADTATDTLTLVAGTGIVLTTNAGTDTITITNSVTGLADADYGDITVSSSGTVWNIDAGVVTETELNASVNASLDLADTALQAADIGVSIQGYDADLTDLSTKWTTASASGQASLQFHEDTDNGTNKVTLQAAASLGGDVVTTLPSATGTLANTSDIPNTFGTIAVSGQSDVVADSTTDTLTLAAGSGIAITTNAGTDTITIAATGSSPFVLLSTQTASNSASIDFTSDITSTYKRYWIRFDNVAIQTDGEDLGLRVSTDGGSSFVSSAGAYRYSLNWRNEGSASGGAGTNTEIRLSDSATGIGNAATESISGDLFVEDPANTASYCLIYGSSAFTTTNGQPSHGQFFGYYQTAGSAINALRFLMSSGNIVSGTFKLYGVS